MNVIDHNNYLESTKKLKEKHFKRVCAYLKHFSINDYEFDRNEQREQASRRLNSNILNYLSRDLLKF